MNGTWTLEALGELVQEQLDMHDDCPSGCSLPADILAEMGRKELPTNDAGWKVLVAYANLLWQLARWEKTKNLTAEESKVIRDTLANLANSWDTPQAKLARLLNANSAFRGDAQKVAAALLAQGYKK